MTIIRAVLVAAFLATIPGMAILVDAPAAMAQISANTPKPHSPDCVPVGVEKRPDGSVWAVEDCFGTNFYYRMDHPTK